MRMSGFRTDRNLETYARLSVACHFNIPRVEDYCEVFPRFYSLLILCWGQFRPRLHVFVNVSRFVAFANMLSSHDRPYSTAIS